MNDPLQGLNRDIGEFETFVDRFCKFNLIVATQMDAILSGNTDGLPNLCESNDYDIKKSQIVEDIKKNIISFKEKGNAAFREQNFGLAIELYAKAINGSNDPSVIYANGMKPTDPFRYLDSLFIPKSIPTDPVLYVNRALCYFRLKNYAQCVNDCEKALSLEPGCVKALYRKAQAFMQLSGYKDSLAALKTCQKYLNESVELQLQVSLTVVANEIRELELLIEDGNITKQEKHDLIHNPSSIFLEKFLNGLEMEKVIEEEITETNRIIAILNSNISMQHSFRLMNGFQRIIISNKSASKKWYDIIYHATTNNEKNVRELGQKMDLLLETITSLKDFEALSMLLRLLRKHSTLSYHFSKARPLNTLIGPSLLQSLNLVPLESKVWIFDFFLVQFNKTLDIKAKWGISIGKLLSESAKYAEQKSELFFSSLCVKIIYNATVHTSKEVDHAVVVNSNRLVQGLAILLSYSDVNFDLNTKILASLFNIICKDDCNRHSLLEETGLVISLQEKMLKQEYYHHSLRLMAKLSIQNANTLKPYLPKLDWHLCSKVLLAGLNENSCSEIGDWLQLLLVFVNNQPQHIVEFQKNNGFNTLLILLRKCTDDAVKYQRIIGNTSLVLDKCAIDVETQGKLITCGILHVLIHLLRKLAFISKTASKNIAICVAKLYRHGIFFLNVELGVEIAREMKVIELLALYTAK
jgi:tetratricopeptide (TPR) repeat protein